jgi:hypothetical protein
MDKRYKPIAVVAGGLIVVNLLANFISRVAFHHNQNAKDNIALIGVVIVGLVFLIFGYRWVTRFPLTRAVGEILLTWVIACLGSVLLGPLAGWTYPFNTGAGDFFLGIWLYGAVGLGAALFGALFAFAFKQDYQAQALKRYTRTAMSKPRRVVRR